MIFLDLASVLFLLLLLTYYGMSHLFLLIFGTILLFLSVYDSRTRRLSAAFTRMFSLPGNSGEGRFNWLPILLSAVLILYSIPLFAEHGLVNEGQRAAMQGGLFHRFALCSAAAAGIIIAAALYAAAANREK